MRCGRQDTYTRKGIRTCLARGKSGITKRCNYRGRERQCPSWEPEKRFVEIYGKHSGEWGPEF